MRFERPDTKRRGMILLRIDNHQLLWNDNVCVSAGRAFALRIPSRNNYIRISRYGLDAVHKVCASNPFRMTTFSSVAKQLLCNDNVYKKSGGGRRDLRFKRRAAAFSAASGRVRR